MGLTEQLMDRLDVTCEQAEGGAGILLQLARDRLLREEFSKIADTVPALSDIVAKAPEFTTPSQRRLLILLSRLAGGLGGTAGLGRVFGRLGMGRSDIKGFVEVILGYFRQQGGPEVELLLRGVFR